MIFLNPCNDVAFKKIFGSEAHKEITISFLNSILENKNEKTIISINFGTTEQLPQANNKKDNILEICCIDQAGNKYIVEMQVAPVREFGKRMVYYGAKTYSMQLARSKPYHQLMPVIVVAIVDFNMFPDKDSYKSIHRILDCKTYENDLTALSFAFVELKKFNKTEKDLVTDEDKWIYFMKEIKQQNHIPAALDEGEFAQACAIAERIKWTEEQLNAYDDAFVRETDQQTTRELAFEEGEKKAQIAIARQLLSKFTVPEIATITGLSIEEINNLIE